MMFSYHQCPTGFPANVVDTLDDYSLISLNTSKRT